MTPSHPEAVRARFRAIVAKTDERLAREVEEALAKVKALPTPRGRHDLVLTPKARRSAAATI